ADDRLGARESDEASRHRAHASIPRDLRAARYAHPSRSSDDRRGQAGADRSWHSSEDGAGTIMNFAFRPVTASRLRLGLVVASIRGSVSLISLHAQSPARPEPPSSQQPASPPGQPAAQPAQNPQQPDAGRQAPSFRAGVDLVSLNVTVSENGSARYVTDLEQQDFQVYEDGVLQEVTFFNKTNLPVALGLLLDTSASMEAKLPLAQEAAIGFAKKLRPQDLAEVIDFDSRVLILQTFTSKASELEQAIRKTSAGGSTSMYNAIY